MQELAVRPSALVAFTQMGGEGVHWVGLSPFNDMKHMFQNLGDGTYQHSGVLAVRQAVVSGVNLTFKFYSTTLLPATGGQPVEGQPTVSRIAQQLLAEGVREVVVVSDDPKSLLDSEHLPVGVNTHSRDALESVQTRLSRLKVLQQSSMRKPVQQRSVAVVNATLWSIRSGVYS